MARPVLQLKHMYDDRRNPRSDAGLLSTSPQNRSSGSDHDIKICKCSKAGRGHHIRINIILS
jgi:hypothetical protein